MNRTTLNFFKYREKPISNKQGFIQKEVDVDYTGYINPIKYKLKQLYKSTGNPKVTEIINDIDLFLEKLKSK